MSKPHKRRGNPDFRHFVSPPNIPIADVEARLIALVTPGTFANLKTVKDKERSLRDRVLTLPVMAAIVVSLVYRQVRYLSEVLRLLEQEGLLWVEAMSVSKQALSQRLASLPAELFRDIFEQVIQRLSAQAVDPHLISARWQGVRAQFSVVWMADGSTLERLQRHLGMLQTKVKPPLAGKIMMVVEAFTHRPVTTWYSCAAERSETAWWEALRQRLPQGGLLVVDLGFYGFEWFDALSQDGKFVVTRQRKQVSYKVLKTLAQGNHYRDQVIEMGLHDNPPCRHPMRQVSVLWGKTWYTYLTNVLDPQRLSAQQVCELYRCRWQIEDAFALTKRLLGLAYLWVGGQNGVQIQLYATWMFYAVLNDLCAEVALALAQPLELISVEMVFRSLYHFARAKTRDSTVQLIPFLVQNQRSFGLVKARTKRQRRNAAQSLDIWASTLT